MHSRAFDVLHHSGYQDIFTVTDSVDFYLDALEISIDQNGLARHCPKRPVEIAFQIPGPVHDLHRASA